MGGQPLRCPYIFHCAYLSCGSCLRLENPGEREPTIGSKRCPLLYQPHIPETPSKKPSNKVYYLLHVSYKAHEETASMKRVICKSFVRMREFMCRLFGTFANHLPIVARSGENPEDKTVDIDSLISLESYIKRNRVYIYTSYR
jgi:hypothetical protein